MKYLLDTNTDEMFTGYQYVTNIKRMMDFHAVRTWCNESFGISERDVLIHGRYVAEQWAWHLDYQRHRVFLKSEQELTWFKLKFGENDPD